MLFSHTIVSLTTTDSRFQHQQSIVRSRTLPLSKPFIVFVHDLGTTTLDVGPWSSSGCSHEACIFWHTCIHIVCVWLILSFINEPLRGEWGVCVKRSSCQTLLQKWGFLQINSKIQKNCDISSDAFIVSTRSGSIFLLHRTYACEIGNYFTNVHNSVKYLRIVA